MLFKIYTSDLPDRGERSECRSEQTSVLLLSPSWLLKLDIENLLVNVIQAGLLNTTSTAQHRREMLQEIMRRGMSSLGTDVPSEREINRLAARNEDEFWLFKKMDVERRQRERYRSRLMEENEVPDWVFLRNHPESSKPKLQTDNLVLGKRQRNEVICTDLLSDSQWMKAVKEGEDLSKTNSVARTKRVVSEGEKNEVVSLSNEDCSESEQGKNGVSESEGEGAGGGDSWHVLWKTHKRKRSSHVNDSATPHGK